MKQIFILFISICSINCFAQNEFGRQSNELIYSDQTVKQLKFIVDSLNLKFKSCDLNKIYKAKSQTIGNYISLSGKQAEAAKRDLDANISFDNFIEKYPATEKEKDLLVVRFKYKNYKDVPVLEFNSVELNGKYNHRITFTGDYIKYEEPLKQSWVINYEPGSKSNEAFLNAFYIKDSFKQNPLPVTYAKMIQYSDCMVDTSTQVFFQKAVKTGVRFSNKKHKKIEELENYIAKKTLRPAYIKDEDDEVFYKKLGEWALIRRAKIDSLYKKDSYFVLLFNEAINEAVENGGGDDDFEELVGLYYAKKTALELKRNRIVVGGCSMDDSPRIHAMNIAKLSAETANWEIFLRSHLDIMNDRFDRMSDGSYAQSGRKTYIKELEVLDINVLDLLLGISLRVENASNNHYYGNIGRLGRALAETKNASLIEEKMLNMIIDHDLDDYNRILIYYLFLNYNYNLSDKEIQSANVEKLNKAVKTLPNYLVGKLVPEEKGK